MKIGIIQEGPVYFDLEKSLKKAINLIEEAVEKGANLVVFGETWLTGYPIWLDHCSDIALWDHLPTKKVFAQMYKNGIEVPGKATRIFANLAKKHRIVIVLGANEVIKKGIGNGTIFNTLLIFDEEGNLANHHRKLMPTYTEKMLYGMGDGQGLKTVATSFGQVGGLICWEHWMPLARQALHNEGETIHIALWPNVHELLQIASRSYAFEGRCFVVAVGQILAVKDIPTILKPSGDPEDLLLKGGSCVIAPNGQYILEPQFNQGGIFIVEIENLDQIYEERMTLDVSGHYNRLDIFDFQVNKRRMF